MFMLSEKLTICIQATEIALQGDFVSAWLGETQVAIFRASEVIGCWIERKTDNDL